MKILYGTGNWAKFSAMQRRLESLGIELIDLNYMKEKGITIPVVTEDGKTPLENARQKATAYYEAFQIPVFSCDSGLYFEDVPDEIQPGVHVRNVNGECLSDEQMIEYYAGLVKQYGKLTARYKNAICFVMDETHIYEAMEPSMESEKFILTDIPHGRIRKKGFPLDSMSIDIKTNKYYYDLPEDELDQVAVEDGFLDFFQKILDERMGNKQRHMEQIFREIESSDKWQTVEKITKGWSADEKYKITTKHGEVLLLRISSIDRYDEKKKEFDMITKYSELGIHMSMPIEFGICNQNKSVYMILSWVEGQDLEDVLPRLSKEEQYRLGRRAGEILRKIHELPVEEKDMPIHTKVEKKRFQLSKYEESNVRIANDEIAIKYVKENIDKIWKEKPVYQHGDFHPGNLIYMKNGEIGVIDFNRWEVGDPYEEFYKLESFGRELSIPYCIGQINAYFNDDVPKDFWDILAVYVAHASLYSIKWAEKFGQEEIDGMVDRCKVAFEDYDYFKRSIPTWYKENK